MNRELNDAANTLLGKMTAHAHQAALNAGVASPGGCPLSPEALDRLWSGWDWSGQMTEDEKKSAIALFGFAFGEYLALQTGMQWRIVSDEFGDDYALVWPKTDVSAFPLATVGKRLGGQPFFTSISRALIQEVRSAAARQARPWWKVW
ncbi:MAG: DUF3806 domain-containing protein [Planctomycetes bacterium]|nr:DUF3806 domain-containing protein [Planctomycetota bacterium]